MRKKFNLPVQYLPINSFFLLVIFVLSNSFLSYENKISFEIKIFIFLAGIFIPFLLAIFFDKPYSRNQSSNDWQKTNIPFWSWVLLGTAILILQIILITRWKDWPRPDVGLMAFYATELCHQWNWTCFYSQAQTPPFSIWCLAFVFKFFKPSFEMIQIFPSLFTLAGIVAVYFAAIVFSTQSVAFILVALAGLSFFPLYLSRFCDYTPILFFFETICIAVLGWLYASKKKLSFLKAFSLGFLASFGLGLATVWPLALLMITFAVYFHFRSFSPFPARSWFGYLTAVTLIAGFFLWICLEEKTGQHLQSLFVLPGSEDLAKLFNDIFSNVTSLFWGCRLQNSYGPVWGGLLNPILGSFFILGVLSMFLNPVSPWVRCALGSIFVFLLPGFISRGFNVLRILLVLPFLLFIAGIGIQFFLNSLQARWRYLFLILILTFSFSLDLNHLWKSRSFFFPTSEKKVSLENSPWKEYSILKNEYEKEGPGLILLNLQPDLSDLSLHTACYSFNAADNPEIDLKKATWVSVIENANYKPFIQRRFPQARFYILGPDQFWNQGPLMLVIIPITDKNRTVFQTWFTAEKDFHKTDSDVLFDHSESYHKSIINCFKTIEPSLESDRFLASIFYEKLIYFQRKTHNFSQIIQWIVLAEKKGYPAAHLFVTEGLLWRAEGNYPEAEKAFKRALHSRLNLTDAPKNLEILSLLKKTQ